VWTRENRENPSRSGGRRKIDKPPKKRDGKDRYSTRRYRAEVFLARPISLKKKTTRRGSIHQKQKKGGGITHWSRTRAAAATARKTAVSPRLRTKGGRKGLLGEEITAVYKVHHGWGLSPLFVAKATLASREKPPRGKRRELKSEGNSPRPGCGTSCIHGRISPGKKVVTLKLRERSWQYEIGGSPSSFLSRDGASLVGKASFLRGGPLVRGRGVRGGRIFVSVI